MKLTPEQCEDILANGGKITDDDGSEIVFEKDKTSEDTRSLFKLLGETIRELGAANEALRQVKQAPPPAPIAPAPAPAPAPAAPSPTAWNVRVTERDRETGRINSLQFVAWTKVQ